MRKRKQTASPVDPDARERALAALALSRRDGLSLSQAARQMHTSRKTVLRHAGAGFRKEGRRYVARPFDRIPREMTLLTAHGPVFVTIRDSRQASVLGEHASAVRLYIERGDTAGLDRLRGRAITLKGTRYELLTDPSTLDRLAAGAELHYELYKR